MDVVDMNPSEIKQPNPQLKTTRPKMLAPTNIPSLKQKVAVLQQPTLIEMESKITALFKQNASLKGQIADLRKLKKGKNATEIRLSRPSLDQGIMNQYQISLKYERKKFGVLLLDNERLKLQIQELKQTIKIEKKAKLAGAQAMHQTELQSWKGKVSEANSRAENLRLALERKDMSNNLVTRERDQLILQMAAIRRLQVHISHHMTPNRPATSESRYDMSLRSAKIQMEYKAYVSDTLSTPSNQQVT